MTRVHMHTLQTPMVESWNSEAHPPNQNIMKCHVRFSLFPPSQAHKALLPRVRSVSSIQSVNWRPTPKFFSTYLAELLALMVWQLVAQALESGIDALHSPPLVAVGNLSPHLLVVHHQTRSLLLTTTRRLAVPVLDQILRVAHSISACT